MTTIIAKDKCLVADRRVVVNAIKQGIIGVRDAVKIQKLPYCIYGISGFEKSLEVGGYSPILFSNTIATLCALNYLCVDNKEREKVIMEGTGWSRKMFLRFRSKARIAHEAVGKDFATTLMEYRQNLIILTHENILLLQDGIFTRAEHSESVVLGSGAKMAHILLDHNVPYEEIYPALRSCGIPTGAVFDKFCLDDLDKSLVPPLSEPNFTAMISVATSDKIKEALSKGEISEKVATDTYHGMVDLIATLLTIGKVKNKRWYFSKKAVADWRDVEAIVKNMEIISLACNMMRVCEKEYIAAREKAAP